MWKESTTTTTTTTAGWPAAGVVGVENYYFGGERESQYPCGKPLVLATRHPDFSPDTEFHKLVPD